MFRAFRFDLHPTAEQEELLRQTVGVCRLVYNLALGQRRDFWRQYRRTTGRSISFASQCRELTELRAQVPWIAAVNRVAQEQALQDLDGSFASFFSGRTRFPRARKKGEDDTCRFRGGGVWTKALNGRWGVVRLPGVGEVRFRSTRAVEGDLKSITVRHTADGWQMAAITFRDHAPGEHPGPSVGIDRGVATSLALSTGEAFHMPASIGGLAARVGRAQRVLARRKRGSTRYRRQRCRVAKLQAKAARIRRDFHHRAALSIATRFSAVALEDLKSAAMTRSAAGTAEAPGRNVAQKRGLNRAVLNQGWRSFETILAYKLEERGGVLAKVPAAYTSQTCSECGVVDAASRKSQAVFACVHCGHEAHADTNAAIEILRRHTSGLRMEGRHSSTPDEVRTVGAIAA
jgi:putative transposase